MFDETKTKLAEQKSWATSVTAKEMQAHFVAVVHNLLLLWQDRHEQAGVTNTAEAVRKQERVEQQEKVLAEKQQALPMLYKTLPRFTQAPYKLIRWLRVHWHLPTSLNQALRQLQLLYATL